MPPTKQAARTFQWAREATKGTDLAATSKIAVENIAFTAEDLVERPKLAKGLLTRNPGNETIVFRGERFSVPEGPLNYEQLQNWLSMAVKGAVAPTGVGPYVWTFARTLTADPALDAFTLERRLTDGTTPVDHAWHYATLSRIGFSGARSGTVKFSAEGFARRRQTETLTAALTMPTTEHPAFGQSRVFVDTSWAGLGGTAYATQIYGWKVDFLTGAKPQETADNRTDLDFSIVTIDGYEVGLEVEIMALLTQTQYNAELAAAEAQTLRAVRVQVDGSSSRQIQWDMLLKYSEMPHSIGEQDGQDIVSLKLVDATDGTNQFQCKVTNNIATLV